MKFRLSTFLFGLIVVSGCNLLSDRQPPPLSFFHPKNDLIRYTGRADYTYKDEVRLYQPGVYLEFAFKGRECRLIIQDQQLGSAKQNYLELVLDGQSRRIRLEGRNSIDTILVAENLDNKVHHVLICKNTEANIGWISVRGILCDELHGLPREPSRKIEFIGNSITCGAGADTSEVACGEGRWHDQHNAYYSYGPVAAREMNAQWHLSAVSGIGLIRSCCGMEIHMPEVFDKIDMRGDSLNWSFEEYQPDVVTICLGQNDGIQDSLAFCSAYVQFIQDIRSYYPKAEIICLTSPMGDAQLTGMLKKYLTGVVDFLQAQGDLKVDKYFFTKQYIGGCDAHPSLEEHREIAAELVHFLKQRMDWS